MGLLVLLYCLNDVLPAPVFYAVLAIVGILGARELHKPNVTIRQGLKTT